MQYILYNGKLVLANIPVLSPDNRSFRYGEGLFETMRKTERGIPLWQRHIERLEAGMQLLDMSFPPHYGANALYQVIGKLCQKNGITSDARIRFTCFKGDGGLWEPLNEFQFVIQCWPLSPTKFNENGLDLALFTKAFKSCDVLSSIKSNNYLLYALAAQEAKQQKCNEAIVLNQHDRIADATIANLFFIKNDIIHTPALTEAPVAGVMRAHLLAQLPNHGWQVEQGSYIAEDIEAAEEVFLTNAIHGIRWVKSFGAGEYQNAKTANIYHQVVAPLFE